MTLRRILRTKMKRREDGENEIRRGVTILALTCLSVTILALTCLSVTILALYMP
jgi:hypothetical protein